MSTIHIIIALAGGVILLLILLSVRRVPVAEHHVVNRLGRFDRTLRPGWHLIVPLLERVGHRVAMGGRVLEVHFTDLVCADGQHLIAEGLIYFQVLDAIKAAERLDNLSAQARDLAESGTRGLVAELPASGLLQRSSRDINSWLLGVLNASAEDWGVRITRIELDFTEQGP